MPQVVRVFRAEAKPGREREFETFFVREAVPLVRSHAGLVSLEVGLPEPSTPRSFLMITRWKDLDALRGFAGESWSQAVIDPREAHLLERVSVDHYLRFPE